MATRYDVFELKAQVSKEGWIKDTPVLTRSGIFTYRTPDGKERRELRTDEEVFSEESLASLLGIPVTDKHNGLLNTDNVAGIIGSVLSSGKRLDENVVADVVIHNAKQIGNRRELSLGYECDIEETSGKYNGHRYDAIQKRIRYNHLAVVEKGRAGNARLRLDSTDGTSFPFEQQEVTMETKLVTVRLDDIDYQASPEIAKALNKTRDEHKELKQRYDTLEAERDTLKTKVDKHTAELDTAKASARSELRERLELESVASQHAIKVDEADTNNVIKSKVIGKLNPDLRLDGKSEDYISSAYDISIATAKTKKVSGQIHELNRRQDSDNANVGKTASMIAREKMLARLRGEKDNAA